MKKLRKWLYWNLANFLSASRFLSLLIHSRIWSSMSIEMTWVFILFLCLTDLLDGIVARRIGNFKGIGMAIDTSADKVMILSVSIWILLKVKNISPGMMEMIILGEILPFSIGLFGIGLAWKKNRSRGLSAIAKEIWGRWKISIPGKMAMIFYFIMAIFIYLDIAFSGNEIFFHFYLVSFGAGFIFRIISIGYYLMDLNNWQKAYNMTT